MTDDELMAKLAVEFTIYPEQGNYIYAPTGEEYVELFSGGTKEEGRHGAAVALDEATAIRMLYFAILHNFEDCDVPATVYWRIKPDVYRWTMYNEISALLDMPYPAYEPVDVYRARARLLISNKPVIAPAVLKEKEPA